MKVIMKDDEVFTKAHEGYQAFTRDDRIREVYEAREKALKDYNSGMKQRDVEKDHKGRKSSSPLGQGALNPCCVHIVNLTI